MTDPARLFEGEATEFERELLGAAANERPSPELIGSLEQALGIGAAGANAAAGAGLSFSGYAALAALTMGGAAIGWVALRGPVAPAPVELARTAPTAAKPPAVAAPVATNPAPRAVAASEPAAAPKRAPAAAKSAAADELRGEIRLIDAARSALRAGSPEQARQLLEKYAQRYPNGSFRQEAAVLRVEALERSGQRAKASSLARQFLEEHPESPHVERLERAAE
jgi:TolA-binding protein